MRSTNLARVSAIVALVISTAGVAAPSASARSAPGTALTCGAVVTSNTVLRNDLTCAGTAITVDRNVRLDLRGHRILGPGSASGLPGIVLSGSAQDVTITNGQIAGWGSGVRGSSGDSQRIVVDRVSFADNDAAIADTTGSSVAITRSTFTGNTFGVGGLSQVVTVDRSSFVRNGTATAAAISGRLTITRTTLTDNETAVDCYESWCDISRTTFKGNGTGVHNNWGEANIATSMFIGNDRGVLLKGYGQYGTLTSSTFKNNTTGIESSYFDHTTIRGNTFTGNGTGFLSRVDPDTFTESWTLLVGNTFRHNTDGIFSTHIGVQLANNVAMNNTGWGIYTENAVDLGGNRARNNGNSPQCTGVAC